MDRDTTLGDAEVRESECGSITEVESCFSTAGTNQYSDIGSISSYSQPNIRTECNF